MCMGILVIFYLNKKIVYLCASNQKNIEGRRNKRIFWYVTPPPLRKITYKYRCMGIFVISYAGFTFESATRLRQMLQCPRQTVHLHSVVDIVGNLVYDKFLETEWRRFQICRRQCLQLLLVKKPIPGGAAINILQRWSWRTDITVEAWEEDVEYAFWNLFKSFCSDFGCTNVIQCLHWFKFVE